MKCSPFYIYITNTPLGVSPDAPAAFEELFLYACPKFVSANGPPYEDADAIDKLITASGDHESAPPVNIQTDCTRRHLDLFLADVAAQLPVPTLRSFLKLYTSLGTKKLANFLDADEEDLVQEMMVLKQASRCISRVAGSEGDGLLEGQMITTSDLNFVIDEVTPSESVMGNITDACRSLQNMVNIAESTIGRRYAGWFIKNTERAQKILDDLKTMPLPPPPKVTTAQHSAATTAGETKPGRPKVAWGGVKAVS